MYNTKYNPDKPIELRDYDRLNRVEFAEQLAKMLLNLHKGSYEDTFTVGLYGKWGCGKTSIVNLTLSEIERIETKEKISAARKLIVMRFEPWNFSDTNQLMQQFFVQLASKFEKSGEAAKKTVGKYLRDYAGAFSLLKAVPYVGEMLAVLGQAAAADFGERLSAVPNLSEQKNKLIKALQELKNTSVLIVMDDLDRLSSEQIRCVFQLVTSVANFPKVTYLLVCDKDIVVKALEEVQQGRGEDYLEKVIQVPIEVPELDGNDLLRVLEAEMDKLRADFPKVGFSTEHWKKIFWFCIVPFVDSLRDVNRLGNMLRFKLGAIAAEVNLADLAAITLLEMKHPKVYGWVRGRRLAFFSRNILSCSEHEIEANVRKKLQEEDHSKEPDAETVEKLTHFLQLLFHWSTSEKVQRTENRIAHQKKFDRYFALNVPKVGFRTEDVVRFLEELPEEELLTALLQWEVAGVLDEFLREAAARSDSVPAARVELLVRIFFVATSQLQEESIETAAAGFMIVSLLQQLTPQERISLFAEYIRVTTEKTMLLVIWTLHVLQEDHRVSRDWEMDALREAFSLRMEQLSEREDFFRMNKIHRALTLWKKLEPVRCKARMEEFFKDDMKVLRYFSQHVSHKSDNWHTINDTYTMFFNTNRVLDAGWRCLSEGCFFGLSHNERDSFAILYLLVTKLDVDKSFTGRETEYKISWVEIIALLDQWRAKFGLDQWRARGDLSQSDLSDATSLLAQWRAEYDAARQNA